MSLEDDGDSYSEREVLWVNNASTEQPNQSSHRQSRMLLPAAVSVASLGGVLFGYDIGIISGAILNIRKEFHLSCFQQELVVSFLVIGGLLSSFVGGILIDYFGRKITIIANAYLFMFGALILSFSNSFQIFLVGRLLLGFAVALSAVGDCVYISEIAPPRKRGLLVSLNELGITMGILLAYLANYLLINQPNGWRYMFGISAIPAIFQAIGMLFLPYSPRWLVIKEKYEKAEKVISIVWPHLNTKLELARLKTSLSREKNYRMCDLFSKKDNMRMRMFIGCGTILFQQLTGQPTVLYYAPVLFKTLGFNMNTSATLATIGLGAVKVVFTLATLLSVDKLGRRTFLLVGATIMTISVIMLSAVTEPFHDLNRNPACHDMAGGQRLHNNLLNSGNKTCVGVALNHSHPESSSTQHHDVERMVDNLSKANVKFSSNSTSRCQNITNDEIDDDDERFEQIPKGVKYTCLFALMLFVVGYAVGYGPMSWLLLTEIFPTAVKGRAASIATSVNWGTNIILSMTFLDVIGSLGPFYTFLMYSLIGVASIIFLYHFVPETNGKSLEDVNDMLNRKNLRCKTISCCDKDAMTYVDESDILLTNEPTDLSMNDDDRDEDVV